MQVELSAKELAYVTRVVGLAGPDEIGVNALQQLEAACRSDVQATTYWHEYLDMPFLEMFARKDFRFLEQPLTHPRVALLSIIDKHFPEGRWANA